MAPKYLRKSTKFMGQADMRAARRLTNLVSPVVVALLLRSQTERETPDPVPYSGERAWGWDGMGKSVGSLALAASFLAFSPSTFLRWTLFLSIMFSVVSLLELSINFSLGAAFFCIVIAARWVPDSFL